MAPEDVEVVRAVLQPDAGLGAEEDWLGFEAEPSEADPSETEEAAEDETEEEIERLQQELAASRRRQEVLELFMDALGG